MSTTNDTTNSESTPTITSDRIAALKADDDDDDAVNARRLSATKAAARQNIAAAPLKEPEGEYVRSVIERFGKPVAHAPAPAAASAASSVAPTVSQVELSAMRNELTSLRRRLQTEQQERELALAAKRDLEAQLAASHTRGAKLESANKSELESKLAQLDAEKARFTDLLAAHDNLQRVLETKRNESDLATARIEELRTLLDTQESSGQSRDLAFTDLQARRQSVEQSNAELRDQLVELQDIEALYNDSLKRLHQRDADLRDARDDIDELKAELAQARGEVSALNETEADLSAIAENYQSQLAEMAAENVRLQQELERERAAHANEMLQLEQIAAEKAKLEDESAKLRVEAEENSHLRDVLVTMKTRMDQLSKTERELSTSTALTASKISAKESALKEKLREKERLERRARAAVAKLEKARAQKDAELQRLKQAAADSEKSASVTRREIEQQLRATYDGELAALKKERDRFERKYERAEKALAHVTAEHSRCQTTTAAASPPPQQQFSDAQTHRTPRRHRTPRESSFDSSSARWASKFFVLDDELRSPKGGSGAAEQ